VSPIEENDFAKALGTGIDIRIMPNVAVRMIQADYLLSRLAASKPA